MGAVGNTMRNPESTPEELTKESQQISQLPETKSRKVNWGYEKKTKNESHTQGRVPTVVDLSLTEMYRSLPPLTPVHFPTVSDWK